jgi:hypothetical protein
MLTFSALEPPRRRDRLTPEGNHVRTRSERILLPLVLAYLPVPIAGAILSAIWNVGASPEGGAGDMFLSGTALTPPLFLPAVLLGAAVAARRGGTIGRIGAGIASLVGLAFLAGSTLNLPNDFAAADAAGTPLALSAALAVVHILLAIGLLWNAVPAVFRRRRAAAAPSAPATA